MTYLCIRKEEQHQTTRIMSTIFLYLVLAVIAIAAVLVFIQTMRDFLLSEDTKKWFYSTKIGAKYCNRKNKVEILTDEQFHMLWSGKIVEAE